MSVNKIVLSSSILQTRKTPKAREGLLSNAVQTFQILPIIVVHRVKVMKDHAVEHVLPGRTSSYLLI